VAADAEIDAIRRTAREFRTAEQVREAIDRMASQIAADLARKRPLVVAVMHGGAFAAVHLCARFDFPHEFDYRHVGRYGAGLSGGELTWIVRPKATYGGRVILLVEDVVDKGLTLTAVQAEIERIGVAELRTAVLVSKTGHSNNPLPKVDYVGLQAGPDYLFGCGMDYKGYWRNLPSLFVVDADRGAS
jgi:hypoxanthine phosphoribosyltransferase